MVNKEIVDWIKSQEDKGYSEDKLRAYLISSKYDEKEISEAINFIHKNKKSGIKDNQINNSHPSNIMGIFSLVFGILSILLSPTFILSILAAIIGIVLSIIQRKKYANSIATAGLVTSIIGIVLSLILPFTLGVLFMAANF